MVASYPATPVSNIASIVEKTRTAFVRGDGNDLAHRKRNLRTLNKLIVDNYQLLTDALHKDLRKPSFESAVYELDFAQAEISVALKNIEKWMKPRKAEDVHIAHATDTLYTVSEPLGLTLIIGAWNFPINLTLGVLAGALGAGNTAIIKPSELAPAVAAAFENIFPKYFPEGTVTIVNGGPEETSALLKHPFDKIFYTGNGHVGRIIARAAAEHLTPVTLELGGKSPVIVADDADPTLVARRLAWSKGANCGQICIAPDYVLCSQTMRDKLLAIFPTMIEEMYGEDMQKSPDYSRIVNLRHFKRIKAILDAHKAKIAYGGRTDESDLFIHVTLLKDVQPTDKVMEDEIFGPILPFVTVNSVDEAINFVNARDKPLALYVFSGKDKVVQKVIKNTSAGTTAINDVLMQICTHALPFGGVGPSGQGRYHGKYSYDTFSHTRSVLYKGALTEKLIVERVNAIRYPPYSATKLSILKTMFARELKMEDDGFFTRVVKVLGKLAVPAVFIALFVHYQRIKPN